jgi:TonB family protein
MALLLLAPLAAPQSQPASSNSQASSPSPRRVKVSPEVASALVVQKAPLSYPDAARHAGIQGPVVLEVVTNCSGDVEEVTVVSGDPALAQAAADAVKKWRYKPYLVEGLPVEMETQVTINFHITPRSQPAAAPLGTFRDNAYFNEYFSLYYPLSRDWVRETDLMRSKLAAEGDAQGFSVLLAAVHIPQDTDPLKADSSFTVLAVNRSGPPPQDCQHYLEALVKDVQSRKEGQQKGDVSQFAIAGHAFYRRDFEYRRGIDHRTFLCTSSNDYLLQWNIVGWSKQAVETAVSTLQSMTASAPPSPAAPPPSTQGDQQVSAQVQVSQGVTMGLLIKRVAPIYPADARHDRIQGTVRMRAVINKTGDIVDLEVMAGPMELVVSAVNAVRKWKYRPYLLKGEPVEVQTEIVVNYTLSG